MKIAVLKIKTIQKAEKQKKDISENDKNLTKQTVKKQKRCEKTAEKGHVCIVSASDGGFFICDSRFDESCFEGDLKIIILFLL